jgi:putative ABC transport system permease protein
MIKNYLKTAFRQVTRNLLNTTINLFGLSVGISCCLIIFLFSANEFSYDKFHSDAENIYRVTTIETSDSGTREFANSFLPYAPLLQSQLRTIEETVRLLPQSVSVSNVQKNKILQEVNFFYVDSNFLDVFSFPLLKGNKKTALSEPHNILITKAI